MGPSWPDCGIVTFTMRGHRLTAQMEVTVAQPQNVAVAAPAEVVESGTPGFAQRVMALPAQRKIMLGGGIAVLIAILVAMALWGREGDYRVLYANLSDKDGGAILAQLQQMQVPYKHADGGAAILVPADKVHDVRLKLASAGLPKGSGGGFELMENQKFGTTQFQERLNFQRGLEGELTRSIQAISSVQSARVHLALPNQNGFFREQQKASASVVLTLYPGRTLDRGQLAGIVHLVSSSVPEMSTKAVSIVDQSGTLLAGQQDSSTDQAGLDAQQLQYVRQIESSYTQRVRDILEPVLGSDNLRAQVTADVDFSQVEQTAEEFKPNQGPNAASTVRSQQTSESSGQGSATPSGVPGAASNQPPVPATAPINGASAPLQAAGTQGAGGNSRRDPAPHYPVAPTVPAGPRSPARGENPHGAAAAGRARQADFSCARVHRRRRQARRLDQGRVGPLPGSEGRGRRHPAVEEARDGGPDPHAGRAGCADPGRPDRRVRCDPPGHPGGQARRIRGRSQPTQRGRGRPARAARHRGGQWPGRGRGRWRAGAGRPRRTGPAPGARPQAGQGKPAGHGLRGPWLDEQLIEVSSHG